MPAWAWLAIAAGGAYYLYRRGVEASPPSARRPGGGRTPGVLPRATAARVLAVARAQEARKRGLTMVDLSAL